MSDKLKNVLLAISALLLSIAGGVSINKNLGSERIDMPLTPILTILAPTTTVNNKPYIAGYKTQVCSLDTINASGTIKFRGSIMDTAPDFNAAQSSTNQWENLEIIDLQNGLSIDGDSGIVLANTTDNRLFEINTNLLQWMSVTSTGALSGSTYVQCKSGSNI